MQEIQKLILKYESSRNGDGGNDDDLMLLDDAKESPSSLYPEKSESVLQTYSKLANLKIDPVCEYLEEFYESDENRQEKALIFCHHKEMMDALTEFFTKTVPLKFIKIDGSTNPVKRGDYVNQYQNDKDTKIALLSITAAGVGITLTAASFVVFAELHWTPGIMLQAEDRAHRIG